MADQFVGEIRMLACNFPPTGWALCNGQLLPISQNTALFSLLGTQFGGNGTSTFALPNLQGNIPFGQGNGPGLTPRVMGETSGAAAVILLPTQMPAHTHTALASTAGGLNTPTSNIWGESKIGKTPLNVYATSNAGTNVSMSPQALPIVGSNQPHNNMPPYLVLNFCIALQGIYPSRS